MFAVARFREGERRLIKVFPFVLFLGFHKYIEESLQSFETNERLVGIPQGIRISSFSE